MATIIPGRWHIPPPVDAAAARGDPADPDRLARVAELEPGRMASALAFLAGYAPGVLDAILTATEPCFDDLFPDEDAPEPYCTRCGAKIGIFTARGSDWRHYAGAPHARNVRTFDTDHAPVLGWRPATDGPALVVL